MSALAFTLSRVASVGSEHGSGEVLHLAGTGSFAVEVAEWAGAAGLEVSGLIELLDDSRVGTRIDGREVVAADSPLAHRQVAIAAGGSRSEHWLRLEPHGWRARTIVHPRAWVSPSATLGDGCVVGPCAVIGAGSDIGPNTLISRGALVGHHVQVGAHVSLLPGVNVASHVVLGERTVVGMGAVIVDHTTVGADATVAAGAVVLADVPAGGRVQGVPARRYPA